MALRGEHISGSVPYGYLSKKIDNKSTYVINPETAPVVKDIFTLCAQGYGPSQIARKLEKQKIYTPGAYLYHKTGKYKTETREKHPYAWDKSCIIHILENRVYTGCVVSGKTKRKSYKCKQTIRQPESQQIIVPDMHEAIIDEDTFNLVANRRKQRRRPTRYGQMDIFSGLVFCNECGARMYHCRSSSINSDSFYYVCRTNTKAGQKCSSHFVRNAVIEEALNDKISYVYDYIAKNEIKNISTRIVEISEMFKNTYEDYKKNIITEKQFKVLVTQYEIEKIVIHERLNKNSPKSQPKIDIIFRHISSGIK